MNLESLTGPTAHTPQTALQLVQQEKQVSRGKETEKHSLDLRCWIIAQDIHLNDRYSAAQERAIQ